MRSLQSELDRIGGNIMAWLADCDMAQRERLTKADPDEYCSNCGEFPHEGKFDFIQNIWIEPRKLLESGICDRCERDFQEQREYLKDQENGN